MVDAWYALIYLKLQSNFPVMAAIQDDSTDDEIGVNLQLAERLSINKGEHVSSNKSPIDKALKQLQNYHKQKHHHDYQSSSSSSLDTHNDPLLMEGAGAYGLHNKKRQNGDKNVEQFTNSKRTCLGDRLLRSPDWKMNNEDVPEVVYFSSQPTNSSVRHLFPDKTYEDHLNNVSDGDDSDFKPRKHYSKNFPQNSGESSKTYRNFSLPKTSKHSKMYENQASGSNGVQFIDSTSDDDSRTIIQNGALKGGRQSPDLNIRKKLWNRKITKFLDSDSDDGQVDYRSRPVIFSSSSDSDDSRPSDKTSKKSNLAPKRSSPKISFTSGPVNKSDHSYYMRDETLRSRLNRAGPSHQLNPPIPSSSEYRPKSSSKFHKSHNKALPSDAAYQNFIPFPIEIEAPFHGRGDTHTQKSLSRNPGSTQPRSLRGHRQPSVRKSPKGISEPRPSNLAHSAEPVRSDVYSGSSNDTTIPPFQPDSFIPRGMSNPSYHAGEGSHSIRSPVSRPITTRHRHRSNNMKSLKGRSSVLDDTKNNLASIYPDLFDAEDSSEVEFFTANSYSDNESNTESLNSLRMNAMPRDQPVQNQETVEVNPVNIGSSEDEISVIFSSAPHQRIDQRRASRTLGRRYRRCPHGFRPTAQDVVSLSPDPVEQVRQVEEDERFARMLQAQFDAEVDPNYTPPPRLSPNLPMGFSDGHFPPRETSSSDDDSSLDLHMETDFPQTRVSFHMNPLLHGLNLRLSRYPVRSNFYGSGNGRPTSRHHRRVADFETHFLNWGNRSDLFGLVDASEDSYEAFLGLAELTGDVPRGLQRTEINRLPTRKYITPNGVSSSKGAEVPHKRAELNKECQVCLNDYVNGDILRILPCFHEFHTPCIDPWLKINHTCPVCRVIVNLEE